jgi:flavin-binding protein dodecin
MASAPGFLTNHELDLFLGGGTAGQRQRLRLRKDRLLPEPAELGRVQRFNIALFPRFVLAGLVRDLASISQASETMATISAKVLRSSAFEDVSVAVRESAGLLGTWSFDALIQGVLERAEDAVREWDEVVQRAEVELAERLSISFSTELGVIERVANDVCIVSLDSGGVEQVPCIRVAAVAEQGRAVALERVNVLAKELGYVMPVERTTDDDEDRAMANWFERMAAPAVTVMAVEPEVTHHEPLPYRRSAPRSGRWHGSSTMTRLPAS